MKRHLYFIYLLISTSIYAQKEIIHERMNFVSTTPDSILSTKVLHYAKELGYIDAATQSSYDTGTFLKIRSIESNNIRMEIYLFSFPSQLSHISWGIAIKQEKDYKLYTYGKLPLAILDIANFGLSEKSAHNPAISSIYDILSCLSEDESELKCELRDKARYHYHISNWIRIFKMNYFGNSQLTQIPCLANNPTDPLNLANDLGYEKNKLITDWILTSYGKEYKHKVYTVFHSKRKSLYLIETERHSNKDFDYLFERGKQYDLYQMNNSFIPIMHILKSFFKKNNDALLTSIKCLCLSTLYSQSLD